ncbi:MAG: hypothetical protein HKP27_02930 [Myxococcales bacterium]|nr:hypothetical protein [Myxococcales bacterium]
MNSSDRDLRVLNAGTAGVGAENRCRTYATHPSQERTCAEPTSAKSAYSIQISAMQIFKA